MRIEYHVSQSLFRAEVRCCLIENQAIGATVDLNNRKGLFSFRPLLRGHQVHEVSVVPR